MRRNKQLLNNERTKANVYCYCNYKRLAGLITGVLRPEIRPTAACVCVRALLLNASRRVPHHGGSCAYQQCAG